MRFGYFLLLGLLFLTVLPSCQKVEELILPPDIPLENEGKVFLPQESTFRIAIIGDSISSFKDSSPSDIDGYQGTKYATYYPKGDVKYIENMWWFKVAQSFKVTIDNICNCSWSGSRVTGDSSSTTSASAGCSTKRIIDLSSKGFDPDLVLCYISCNDWAFSVPLGNWSASDSLPSEGIVSNVREAYALMLSKIKQYYPDCLIFCLTNFEDPLRDSTPGWPSNNIIGVSTDDWNKSIIELSTAFGCYSVDLQECGIDYNNAPKYTIDGGLHPNDAGMTLIANKVIKELAAIMNKDE